MKTRKIHQTIIDGVTGRIIDFDATVTEPDANALPGPTIKRTRPERPTAAAARQGGNRHATPKQEPYVTNEDQDELEDWLEELGDWIKILLVFPVGFIAAALAVIWILNAGMEFFFGITVAKFPW